MNRCRQEALKLAEGPQVEEHLRLGGAPLVRKAGRGRAPYKEYPTATPAPPVRTARRAGLQVDLEFKEVCGRYDSDATEWVQHEKVGIPRDYPTDTTADRQLKYLVVLGIATGPYV